MNIRIGLFSESVGWKALLKQEGIPFVTSPDECSPDDYSVIIAGSSENKQNIEKIREFLRSGGSVLMSSAFYTQLTGAQLQRVPLRCLLPRNPSLFQQIGLIDIFLECLIPPGANELSSLDGQNTAYVGELEGGNVITLPFDAGELVLDSRAMTKSFYSSHHRLPFEHVSLISKGTLRTLVSRSLEHLHHVRFLPYLHTWYYPHNSKSVFSFRIDTDYSNKKTLESLYELSERSGIPFTFFVDAKSQQEFIDMFSRMRNQEIGVHCYEHQTFDDYEQNRINIQKAKAILNGNRIEPKGFAAPYGTWNINLAKAIVDTGFDYSSEFLYDYDNLPTFPVVNGKELDSLQLPIHPISIGSLRRLGYSQEMMSEYFHHVIEQKIAASEPLFLYHHPHDGNEQVWEEIFISIQKKEIPSVLFSHYSSWWKRRTAIHYDVRLSGDSLQTQSRESDSSFSIHATRHDGQEAFIPMNAKVDISKLEWKKRSTANTVPSDINRMRKFNPWISIIKAQDLTIGKVLKMLKG